MRSWVFNRVIALPLPNGMADKVISSGAADSPEPPFIILSMGSEQPFLGMPVESKTFNVPFDLWVHDRPGTMVDNIDDGARVLKDGLPITAPAVTGGVSVMACIWDETGADAYDDLFHTNTRRVSFHLVMKR